jgi:hypothetical protein
MIAVRIGTYVRMAVVRTPDYFARHQVCTYVPDDRSAGDLNPPAVWFA